MSLTARSLSVSNSNSTVMLATLSVAVLVVWRTPVTTSIASSIGWTTWRINSLGEAPGWFTVTLTMGRSILGIAVTGSR